MLKRLRSGGGRQTYSSFLSAALLTVTFALGCARPSTVRAIAIVTTDAQDAADSRRWLIHYGAINGQLAFAIFEGSAKGAAAVTSQVTTNSKNDTFYVEIMQPDGTRRKLPAGHKLIEIIEGKYQESSEPVSLEEFAAFIKSKPAGYTIENLLAFAKARQKS